MMDYNPSMENAQDADKNSESNLLRIILVVILFIILVLAGADRVAAHRWNSAQIIINELLEKGEPVSVNHLSQQLSKKPFKEADLGASDYSEEIFEWNGGVKTYRLEVVYSPLKYKVVNLTNRVTTLWYVGNQRPKVRLLFGGDWRSVETD